MCCFFTRNNTHADNSINNIYIDKYTLMINMHEYILKVQIIKSYLP